MYEFLCLSHSHSKRPISILGLTGVALRISPFNFTVRYRCSFLSPLISTSYNSSGIPTGTTSISTFVRCSSLTRFFVSSSMNSCTTFFAASSASSRFHLRLLDNLALKSATASQVTLIDLLPSGYSLDTF